MLFFFIFNKSSDTERNDKEVKEKLENPRRRSRCSRMGSRCGKVGRSVWLFIGSRGSILRAGDPGKRVTGDAGSRRTIHAAHSLSGNDRPSATEVAGKSEEIFPPRGEGKKIGKARYRREMLSLNSSAYKNLRTRYYSSFASCLFAANESCHSFRR